MGPEQSTMTKLSDEPENRSAIKLILMGASGTGKSSLIIPLAIPDLIPGWPGKKLFVRNYDGRDKFKEIALEQLKARLTGKKLTKITQQQYDAAKENIEFVDCIDPRSTVSVAGKSKVGIVSADAWMTARKAFTEWEKHLKPGTILIDDSFTHMANAIAAYTMAASSRLNFSMEGYKDYAPAQMEVSNSLSLLSYLRCDVILTAHQDSYDVKKTSETAERDSQTGMMVFKEEIVDSLMLPSSIGQKGRTAIPSGFNHMLYTTLSRHDIRELRTTPGKGIAPKTPFFGRAKNTYDIDTGLVEYFMLGEQA